MFNSSCKIFLTVFLSAFTVSVIIRMLIRRSHASFHLFWSLFVELKQRQDNLDVEKNTLFSNLYRKNSTTATKTYFRTGRV
ncbi:unnamed protein product, partial [Diabrotica balteata]